MTPLGQRDQVVLLGAGQASAQAADQLRRSGFSGPITLVGDEPHPPYQRPPLSKAYLVGAHNPDWLYYRPAQFWAQRAVTLRLGTPVEAIDRAAGVLRAECGSPIPFDRLLIATGGRARPLAVAGANLPGVHRLRTIDDVDGIRSGLDHARDIVIIGGGFIGLETAAMLISSGRQVTVLEAGPRVLGRVAPPEVSSAMAAIHAERGVDIRTSVTVTAIEASSGRLAVITGDAIFPADLVIVGIGITPEDDLAREAGLATDNGVVVDDLACTSDPRIHAAGDCAAVFDPGAQAYRRRETVHNAIEQARAAALAWAGTSQPYRQAPWVWSDQYSHRLQSVGGSEGADRSVLRGDQRRFSLFHFKSEQLIGADTLDRPDDFAAARRLLNGPRGMAVASAIDSGVALSALAPRQPMAKFERPFSA